MTALESDDHRERRLSQLGYAVEAFLDEDWRYWLVIGKPGEPDTVNIVSNAPPETAIKVIEAMLTIIKERYEAGRRPTEI